MPKLRPIKFRFTSIIDTLEFTSPASVDQQGVFHLTLPEEVGEVAKAIIQHDKLVDVTVTHTEERWRASSRDLDQVKQLVAAAAAAYLRADIHDELVIRYQVSSDAKYAIGPDGTIHPDGTTIHPRQNGTTFGGNLAYGQGAHHYGIRAYARVVLKRTYSRPKGTKVIYERPEENMLAPWGVRLNNFVGLDPLGTEGFSCRELPYTEQGAKFFHDLLLEICRISKMLSEFFADSNRVEKMIAAGAQIALPLQSNGHR